MIFGSLIIDTIGSVESVKAASDIYAPISGKVIEVNAALSDEPGLLNTNAEDSGTSLLISLVEHIVLFALTIGSTPGVQKDIL